MNIKKTLLSSVFCGGLLLASGVQAALPIAYNAILKPDSGWAISKIEAKALGGGAYCALARKFDSNIILTIARNGQDESSIALDFQSPTLAKGRNYDIELEPGYGQTRKFSVTAVSEKALVLKVGKDFAFFDALNRSSILRVKAVKRDLTFDLTNYLNGQQKLNGCLATLTEPAAGEEDEMVVAAASVSPVAATPAPVTPMPVIPASGNEELDSEIRILRDENNRLKSALRSQRQAYEERMMDRPDSSVVNDLSERMLILQKENSTLRQQVNEMTLRGQKDNMSSASACKVDEKSQEIAALVQQVSALRSENERLVKEIEGLNGKIALLNEQLQESDSRIAVADERARIAEEKARTAEEELVAASRRAIALEADLKLANEKAESAMSRLASHDNKQGEQFIAQTQEYEERVKGLLTQIGILEEQNRDLRLELNTAHATAVSTMDSAPLLPVVQNDDALVSKIRMLENDLAKVKQERDQYARQMESLGSSGADSGGAINISTSNWDLEKATRRFNEAEREIRRLGARLEEERARCMTEKREIEHMLFDPAIATQQQVSKLHKLENELVRKDAALSTLEARYEQDIKVLKQELERGEQEILVLEASLKQAQNKEHPRIASAPIIQADPTELKMLQARNQEMSQQIALLQGQIRTIRNRESMELQMVEPASGGDYVRSYKEQPVDHRVFEQEEIAWNQQAVDKNADYESGSYEPVTPMSMEPIDLIESDKVHDLTPVVNSFKNNASEDFVDVSELTSLLERSGFSLKTPVKHEQNPQDGEGVAYSWSSGNLYGTAEQKHIGGLEDFDSKVGAYIEKTESRCQGEFAAMPDIALERSGVYISTYDIACVSESGGSAAASLMFIGQNNILTSFAFETNIDAMDASIEARNKMVEVIDRNGVASL